LTSEPETLKAFRDTWELGIHSYLTYLRDRLLLARELLHESGSIFVQISDENVHLVRNLMDEVFGVENFVSTIVYVKTSGLQAKLIKTTNDFLLWYAKDIKQTKVRKLYSQKVAGNEGASKYTNIELSDGTRRPATEEEILNPKAVDKNARLFSYADTTSQGNTVVEFEHNGKKYYGGWKTTLEGMATLSKMNRLYASKTTLNYIRYLDDFPVYEITNLWNDIAGIMSRSDPKVYVVQTATTAVQRCLLMTTDPGDLVLDITCGSGTTAFVAEQWGRRWITCDTSRVALTLAKQRLMTASFEYYQLAKPEEGVSSGFKYKTVPHITLKSIANNEPPATETLYDQPLSDKKCCRVTSPFTVEAVPAPVVQMLNASAVSEPGAVATGSSVELEPGAVATGSSVELEPAAVATGSSAELEPVATAPGSDIAPADASIARSGESLRQEEWRSELLRTGIRGRRGEKMQFARVEPLAGTRFLHADAELSNEDGTQPQRAVVSFAPEHEPMPPTQVELALMEANKLFPKPKFVIFAAFQFDPQAVANIEQTNWQGVTLLKAQMNADLLTDDLKKSRSSNESFWLIGQPDVQLKKVGVRTRSGSDVLTSEDKNSKPVATAPGSDKGDVLYQVEVLGFDYYNVKEGTIESGGTNRIAVWMLDTNFDGRSLFPQQVFFPLSGAKEGWTKLANNLKAEIDQELIENYHGSKSLPFTVGNYKRIAVKIVDDRGIESLKLIDV
jgi:adenine-specific DNA-methyltransferase